MKLTKRMWTVLIPVALGACAAESESGTTDDVALEVPANLLHNTSFEVGAGRWGAGHTLVGNRRYGETFVRTTDIEKLATDAKNGSYALRLYRRKNGSTRTFALTSPAIKLEPGQRYSLSVWGKVDSSKVAGTLVVSLSNRDTDAAHNFDNGEGSPHQTVIARVRLTPGGWSRAALEDVLIDGLRFDHYVVQIRFVPDPGNQGNDGVAWVDAIKLEKGEAATTYLPRNPTQVGSNFAQPNNIIIRDSDPSDEWVDFILYNGTFSRRVKVRVVYSIYDLFQNRVVVDRIDDTLIGQGGRKVVRISTLNLRKGFYRLVARSGRSVDEKLFSILPKKRPIEPKESVAGAYMRLVPDVIRPLALAGFHWTATLSVAGGVGRWDMIQPGPDASVDAVVQKVIPALKMARRHGIEVIGNISGMKNATTPDWAKEVISFTRPDGTVVLKAVPRVADYQTFVEAIARGYKGWISHWIVEDEADQEYGRSPELVKAYAERYEALYQAIKAVQPEARIAPSGELSFVNGVSAHLHHARIDHLNLGEFTVDEYARADRWLPEEGQIWGVQRRYSINPYRTYRDFENRDVTFRPRLDAKFSTYRAVVRKKFTDVALSYDARVVESRPYAFHSKSLLTFDGALTPRAVALSTLWWLIDGSEHVSEDNDGDGQPDGDQVSLDGRLRTYLFQRSIDGRYVLAVVTSQSPTSGMRIRVPLDPDGLIFRDGFTNPIRVRAAGQDSEVVFNELGFFISGSNKRRLVAWAKALGRTRVHHEEPPIGRLATDGSGQRLQHQAGALGVVVGTDDNFRLFGHGQELIRGDLLRLMPWADYRNRGPRTSIFKPDLNGGGTFVTTMKPGGERSTEITRTIRLKKDEATITWALTNHLPRTVEGGVHVFLDRRFKNAKIDELGHATIDPTFRLDVGVGTVELDFEAVELTREDSWNLAEWRPTDRRGRFAIGRHSGRAYPGNGRTIVRTLKIRALR